LTAKNGALKRFIFDDGVFCGYFGVLNVRKTKPDKGWILLFHHCAPLWTFGGDDCAKPAG
jgi:hypothetical protein